MIGLMKHSFSAGAVMVGPNNKVGIVSQHGTSWSLLKGTLENDENDIAALKRELNEEASLVDFEIIKKLGTYDRYRIGKDGGEEKTELKTITIYLCSTSQKDLIPQDPENPEALWVDPDEVEKLLTHPKDKEFYKKHLAELKDFIRER
jgi:8-oxo-dGTP pyrophosphatase MutT (NUDIX family)